MGMPEDLPEPITWGCAICGDVGTCHSMDDAELAISMHWQLVHADTEGVWTDPRGFEDGSGH